MANLDAKVVRDFGREWAAFDQSAITDEEHLRMFNEYFTPFPWDRLTADAEGFDAGCGSGRWAVLVAPRVGKLHCIDASQEALDVAARRLAGLPNAVFSQASVDDMPLADGSMDFGYSLGVLHHIPDTQAGLQACVSKLKPGAPFLVYLYYALETRPWWFRAVWRMADLGRRVICAMPHGMKLVVTTLIAALVYWPLTRLALLLEACGLNVSGLPLSIYRQRSFYSMRTDALDRFGTRLEKRFSRAQIEAMMQAAGLVDIRFSEKAPFWCAAGLKGERQPA
jgi:SAM-dependent methyltransferase